MEGEYYKTAASVKEYIALAKGVDGSELIDKLKQFLPKNSSLLEIGSGPGTDWKLLSKYFKVIGSDNSNEFLNHLRTSNPDGKFLNLDATTFNTDKTFDGIYSNKVFHHLTPEELTQSLKKQHSILKTDGIICHSFWKGEGSEIFKGLFVNYYEKQDLKSIFENHFEILYLGFYNEFDEDDSILLIGKKK